MVQSDKDTTQSVDTFRLINNDNKSVLASQEDSLNEAEEFETLYTDEDIQSSLMANNYKAFEEIPTTPEVVIEEVKEVKEEKKKKTIKELFDELKSKILNLSDNGKKIVRIIVIFLIIILLVLFVLFERKTHTYKIIINGDKIVSLYEGGLYKENGVEVLNYKDESKRNLVKIDAKVNTDTVGEYYVRYYVNSFWKKNEVRRKVIVLPNPLDNIYFTLNGEDSVEVKLWDKYTDAGYDIRSDEKEDYSKYVSVTNNVNTNKIGTYEVKYLIRINKKQQELVRKVEVVGNRYTVNYSKAATRNNVEVNIISNINDFDYFLVDGHKVLKDNIIYNVTDNGSYNIQMFSTQGKKDDISIKISNIDREVPTGTCKAMISSSNKSTYYSLNIKDASNIKSYKYNGEVYTSNTFNVNSIRNSGNVDVTDEAGNMATIGCSYMYSPITYDSSNNVIQRFDGNTLKYWIEKPSSSYLITHIWVEDPYLQFKVAIPKTFPMLDRAGSIMNNASIKYGYYSKAMIGANASGFVSDVFNTEIGRTYPKWKYSSKSPLVIIDGVVIRNYTNLKQVGGFGTLTYGLKKNGYFSSYYLNDPESKSKNQSNAQLAINDGVKYTFAFGPYLVRSGKLNTNLANTADIRQAIGQIDKNNFVIVTNTANINHRSEGMGLKTLATIMYNLGCVEAYNTDGGGSTNLIYKNRNTNSYTGIVTTTRDVADIMYFVEK